MATTPHIVVIGAGVSGLTAGFELAEGNCEVTILERRPTPGGLARSIECDGGNIDRYYHFICGGDDNLKHFVDQLQLDDRMKWTSGRTGYLVDGTLYPFSTPMEILGFSAIGIMSRIRFGLHGMRARRFTDWRKIEHLTAKEWLIEGMGREAYETIWLPLLRTKFGADAEKVSAPWIWHRIHRVVTSRSSIFRPDTLGYLDGGTTPLIDALRDRITAAGGELQLDTPARNLLTKDGSVTAVETDRATIEADAVISTVPLPQLCRLLPDSHSEYRRQLADIPFLGVVCPLLRLDQQLTDYFWVNINDPRAPFNGFIEYTNLNSTADPEGKTLVYFPLYMPTDDGRFDQDNESLTMDITRGLEVVFEHFDRSQIADWTVTRDRYAQAICEPAFSDRMPDISSPIGRLFLTDSTRLYPADRNVSGMVGLAKKAADLCLEAVDR